MNDLLTSHPWLFLAPLLTGFAFNSASAFTAAWSRRWGKRGGQAITAVLRNALGIPLWVAGIVLAARTPAPPLLPEGAPGQAAGWVLVAAGAAVVAWALAALSLAGRRALVRRCPGGGGALRPGAAPTLRGVIAQLIGVCLLLPRWPVLAACGLAVAWVAIQARLEERDLVERVAGYREYMARVPRFVPRLSR